MNRVRFGGQLSYVCGEREPQISDLVIYCFGACVFNVNSLCDGNEKSRQQKANRRRKFSTINKGGILRPGN